MYSLDYLKQTSPKLSSLPVEAKEGLKNALTDCKQSPKILQNQADDVRIFFNFKQKLGY